MGSDKLTSDTEIDGKTTRRGNFSADSDQLKGILSGKTQRIPFPKLKKAISETLTPKPEQKYRHPEKVGSGGMKEILKVRDRDTARDLAMAVLSPDSEVQEACLARFVYEARITANLEHPNIVPIHDIGVDKAGQPYFTMKMIEGESLAHVLINIAKNKPGYRNDYTLPHLLTIFINVCHAIDFAHSKGIIHLDLKPENVQIGSYGEVLVLDWGLAKVIDEEEDIEFAMTPKSIKELNRKSQDDFERTIDGEVKGTPGFMAPEQAAGENSKKNTTTDIFSLGALLYSILTLKKPIKGVEINDVIEKTIRGEIIPLAKRSPECNIPPPLAAVTMKAMALHQEDRYQTVKDLIDDIEKYTTDYATSAEQPNFLHHSMMWIKRNKVGVSLGSLLAVLLIAFGVTLSFYETKRLSQWGSGRNITPANNQDLLSRWIKSSGQWEVKDDAICAVAGKDNSYILLYDTPLYGNVAVEFDAEIPNAEDLQVGGDLSIILAASEKAPKDRGYFFQVGGIGNTSAVIQKRGGLQASVEYILEPAKKYKIRAEKEGANLRLYCNDQLLISSKDIFYLAGGYLGLYTFGKGKKFSNIKIFHKEVPELVPPTIEGDSFYRESRMAKKGEKTRFLELAKQAYSKVYDSNISSTLSSEALLKRAYVNSELNNIKDAVHDAILLDGFGRTLDLLLLRGLLSFRSTNYKEAYRIYEQAIDTYPDSKVTTVALLMGHLASEKAKGIPDDLRQRFWTLCANNYSSSAFRCNSKHLKSLNFLKGTQFNLIDCSENEISSLKPLKDIALTKLDCADNQISDLSPLLGMQLESLECHNNPISDLSALQGMPLKTLSLTGCPVKDLSVLKHCPSIQRLTLPADIKDLSILKYLPNLKYCNTEWDGWKMTKKEFLRKQQAKKIEIKTEK